MKIYQIGDEIPDEEVKAPDADKVLTVDSLRAKLHEMSIMADIETRSNDVLVRVLDNIGTGQFLANAVDDHFWLKSKAYKTERRGTSVVYFLKMDK
jgi:hypothetical protein